MSRYKSISNETLAHVYQLLKDHRITAITTGEIVSEGLKLLERMTCMREGISRATKQEIEVMIHREKINK